jgi:hypothetical protein
MLADDKASALVDNLAGQWLYTRALAEHEPDQNYFPDFDESLGQAMQQESRLFFQELLSDKQPVETLLTADFAFLNARLATHYGISGVSGADFQKVQLSDKKRGGVLGQGSVLTVTSFPNRTSPVKRGRWVLEQLWCVEVKPPPAGVEVDLPQDAPEGTTLKDQLAKHREDPGCATCHNLMDPVGLALENFDGIGNFRELDNGAPVDPAGVLPGDIPVDGPIELANVIAADSRFPACVTKQFFTYALGRGPTKADDDYFNEMLENLGGQGFALEDLIIEIVKSEPFRMRQQGGGS